MDERQDVAELPAVEQVSPRDAAVLREDAVASSLEDAAVREDVVEEERTSVSKDYQ